MSSYMRSGIHNILPGTLRRSLARFGHGLAVARRKRQLTVPMMAERTGLAKSMKYRAPQPGKRGTQVLQWRGEDYLGKYSRMSFPAASSQPLKLSPIFVATTTAQSIPGATQTTT